MLCEYSRMYIGGLSGQNGHSQYQRIKRNFLKETKKLEYLRRIEHSIKLISKQRQLGIQ
jgi:hypothetical protein